MAGHLHISFLLSIPTDMHIVCRGSFHFHGILTGIINCFLLQSTVHSPVFRKAIADIFDSMMQATLPMSMHASYLMRRVHGDKLPPHDTTNYSAIQAGSIPITAHANAAAYDKNIHSSTHTDSCVSKFLPYCRYEFYLYATMNLVPD